MTTNLLYAVGTLCLWLGGAAAFLALWAPLRRYGLALVGGLLLLLAASGPLFGGQARIPVAWIIMPVAAWGSAACLAWMGVQAVQAWINDSKPKALAAGGWLVGGLLLAAIVAMDRQAHFEILRGSIGVTWAGAAAVTALGLASVGIMTALGRRTESASRWVALVAGCVVFGLPFLWLLITSFKEDRDMAGPNGLIWIPRVQRTVPFMDAEDPLLEGSYKGRWVQVTATGKTPDGKLMVEVLRPSSLRGVSFEAAAGDFHAVAKAAPVVSGPGFTGFVTKELNDGRRVVQFTTPDSLKGTKKTFLASELEPVRDIGLRTQNYVEAMEAMPPETNQGLVYLRNTLILVVLNVLGTLLSSSLVAFGFARLRFPGRDLLFKLLLATMMLPGAVTLLPQFLLFRSLGWVDTLYPLWAPAFLGSAFNVFLLRQFFLQVPNELEDAGKIDGASVLQSYWKIMLPQIGPALAVVAIWTFIGAWNNFMGPLIYINTPENMPLSYALQLFQTERGGAPGLMMAFATMTILPVLALFFFAQRWFVEGVALSGLGGR